MDELVDVRTGATEIVSTINTDAVLDGFYKPII
jgi:hypothetical protein